MQSTFYLGLLKKSMIAPKAAPKANPIAMYWEELAVFFPSAYPNATPIAEPTAIPDPMLGRLFPFILYKVNGLAPNN